MSIEMLNTVSTAPANGFYKTPVCKGVIGSMFLTYTVIHIPIFEHLKQYLSCEIPQVLMSRHVWRILFNRFTFINTKDVICSALVIYYLRIFERRMGSRKFSSFLLGTCSISTLLEICFILFSKLMNVQFPYSSYLPAGLYPFIFPLYVYYFLDIPNISATYILGIPFSGKTIIYLMGMQIGAASPSTVVASICGIIAGILYRCNFLKVQKWLVIPEILAKFGNKMLGSVLETEEPKYRQMAATVELQLQEQVDILERQVRGQGFSERLIDDRGLFRRRPRTEVLSEPSQENVRILVDMGFDESRAFAALRESSNDLETATNILLRQ